MRKLTSLILALAFSLPSILFAQNERECCKRLATKYEAAVEVTLWDNTRVDLLNRHYAIEVDWAPKWAEAIGQSVYYAIVTDARPAVILLVKDFDAEQKHIHRCQAVCVKLGIFLFLEDVGKLPELPEENPPPPDA